MRIQELPPAATRVRGLRTLIVNLFGIETEDGRWFLVDAGLSVASEKIYEWATSRFGGRAPEAILLTHGHFDHVGALDHLLKRWDVPVYAHPLEHPYLNGQSKYPPPDPVVGGGMMAWMSGVYPRGPIDISDRLLEFPEGGSIPGLDGWRVIHTPGHSPGHVSLFRDSDRVLIAGDAVITTRQESFLSVVSQKMELNGPPAYYTPDWISARSSIEQLAALRPSVIAAGHGQPMAGQYVADQLQQLAAYFDYVVKPSHGRYVDEPAISDERGVVSVPPPTMNYAAVAVASAAAAGLAWYMFSQRAGRRSETVVQASNSSSEEDFE